MPHSFAETTGPRPRAFTLIELLVVIAVIALLLGLLLPSVASVRETGRTVKCKSNLRQFGISFESYSASHRGFYSSGSWDNSLMEGYGRIDTTGWVADVLNGGYGIPGKMLCPSSPAQASQSLNMNRLNSQAYQTFTLADVDEFITKGLNTNYCQSWQMAHTDVKDHRQYNDFKNRTKLRGPLADKSVGATTTPSRVVMIGDATVIANPEQGDMVLYRGGQLVGAKVLSDGPTTMVNPPGIQGAGTGRQRFEDFGPVHGKGPKIADAEHDHDRFYGNMLFADAHVEQFADSGKRDGEWSGSAGTYGSIQNVLLYDELEGKVFGGWLTRNGLNF
ncbi:MAG TPA: type II secretion system protein [Phycisphaerales bacterium]|nr:type II secretion system protein [Phycisphaerales bacterium]